jgi:hypothetical protein
LALGLLIAAAASVSISGWILFARDRRASRRDRPPATEAEPAQTTQTTHDPDPPTVSSV